MTKRVSLQATVLNYAADTDKNASTVTHGRPLA